ncbi:MAG: hypothetical protein KIT84_42720 [Labilithrix sp.]|nr:hypothetical protein [Labilithrix sp.]MCW5817792.1 hypothetical protein [Labilithrix sp.]
MPALRFLPCGIFLALLCLPACTVAPELEEEEPASTESAYFGTIPDMVPISAPAGAVASWAQPDSEGAFDQYGYCGATAASNLLRWYGKEVAPRRAIDDGCWSYVGTTPSTLAAYLRDKHSELDCSYRTLDFYADGLATLRRSLEAGRPVIIQFMTGSLNAHWVTAIGVRGAGDDPEIVVMSWAGFYTLQWSRLQDAWRRAWGGYYPHVICDAVSPLAAALHVDR